MKKIFYLLAMLLTLNSCSSLMTMYNVELTQVESPENARKQYGETKIVTQNDEGTTKYSYTDDYIQIAWRVGTDRFYFDLKNRTSHTIKIDWDAISYIDIEGRTQRVIHTGTKYIDKNNAQAKTNLPRNASIVDILMPVDNIIYSAYIGWRVANLIPSFYDTQELQQAHQNQYLGRKMYILFPIEIEGITNDYIFEFNIQNVVQ
jgi:hypothetical protein